MKGLVFTELLEMAETVLSEDEIDEIIDAADLPSGGTYTRGGTYPSEELLTLIGACLAQFAEKAMISLTDYPEKEPEMVEFVIERVS